MRSYLLIILQSLVLVFTLPNNYTSNFLIKNALPPNKTPTKKMDFALLFPSKMRQCTWHFPNRKFVLFILHKVLWNFPLWNWREKNRIDIVVVRSRESGFIFFLLSFIIYNVQSESVNKITRENRESGKRMRVERKRGKLKTFRMSAVIYFFIYHVLAGRITINALCINCCFVCVCLFGRCAFCVRDWERERESGEHFARDDL